MALSSPGGRRISQMRTLSFSIKTLVATPPSTRSSAAMAAPPPLAPPRCGRSRKPILHRKSSVLPGALSWQAMTSAPQFAPDEPIVVGIFYPKIFWNDPDGWARDIEMIEAIDPRVEVIL